MLHTKSEERTTKGRDKFFRNKKILVLLVLSTLIYDNSIANNQVNLWDTIAPKYGTPAIMIAWDESEQNCLPYTDIHSKIFLQWNFFSKVCFKKKKGKGKLKHYLDAKIINRSRHCQCAHLKFEELHEFVFILWEKEVYREITGIFSSKRFCDARKLE